MTISITLNPEHERQLDRSRSPADNAPVGPCDYRANQGPGDGTSDDPKQIHEISEVVRRAIVHANSYEQSAQDHSEHGAKKLRAGGSTEGDEW
ncbi:MAG: hypothetical protein ACHRXM_10290 [Isosphaerales bacterium]